MSSLPEARIQELIRRCMFIREQHSCGCGIYQNDDGVSAFCCKRCFDAGIERLDDIVSVDERSDQIAMWEP